MITQPGAFNLYSDQMKADVCQGTLSELNKVIAANPDVQTNHCSMITSQVYQSYSWFLQDLQDSVLGSLVGALSTQLEAQSAQYAENKDTIQVSLWVD